MKRLARIGLAFLAASISAACAEATQTETISHDTYAEFNKGEPKGVAITDKGQLRLAPEWKVLYDTGQQILWTVTRDAKGNLYAGCGNEGVVFKVTPAGVGTQFFKADEIEVHALAVDKKGNLYAGSSPDGKVYKISPDGKSETFFEPKQKYIWALSFDKNDSLFVATGDKGILYKVSPDGKGEVYYDSDETNLTCLQWDKNGALLVGTDPNSYLYRITPPKERGATNATAFVVYDASQKEIKSIAVASDGTIYAGAIGDSGKEGAVYRVHPDGYTEAIWSSKDMAPFALCLRDDGHLLVGTSDKGMLLSLTLGGETMTLFKSDSAQITTLLPAGEGKVIAATSNLGTLLEVSGKMAKEGVYDSEVIDTKLFADWGRVEWSAQTPKATQIEILSRSGNSSKPEKTWAAWMPVQPGGEIKSPSARFLQYRVRMGSSDGSSSPSVERVRVFYVPRNVAPKITQFEVLDPGFSLEKMAPPPPPQQTSLSTILSNIDKKDQPSTASVQVRIEQRPGLRTAVWKAEDPNKDELRFAVSYKLEGDATWRLLKDKIAETFYSWDSTAWPSGMYLLRVEASDAEANAPEHGLTASETSRAFLVDNTAPKIEIGKATVSARKVTLSFSVTDADSRIAAAEYSVDGRDWLPIVPEDGVFDSKEEAFKLTTPELTAGEHSILIHAADELDNPTAASTNVKIP